MSSLEHLWPIRSFARPIQNSARSALSPGWGHSPYPRGDVRDYLCAVRPDLLQFLVKVKVIAGFALLAQFVYALVDYRCAENQLAKSFEADPHQMQAFRILRRFVLLQDHIAEAGQQNFLKDRPKGNSSSAALRLTFFVILFWRPRLLISTK